MKKTGLALALALAATVAAHAEPCMAQGFTPAPDSPAPEKARPEVPYVPTPDYLVWSMLELADVTPDDVVYDLGCGDGRIVIAAAREFGARAVGIDIDPERIRESRANAEKAGVSDRVRFIEQDLFDADLSEATVVTLYLLPSVNKRLQPKLVRDLEPGTRVVSHSFNMGDWEPERTERVGTRTLYYWVVDENTPVIRPEAPIEASGEISARLAD